MLDDLITFPIRIGLRATSIAVRTGLQATERAVSFASFVLRSATGGRTPAPAPPQSQPSRTARQPVRNGASADGPAPATPGRAPSPPSGRAPSAPSPAPPETPTVDLDAEPTPLTGRPDHVSEEPELVEEFAEPGAEEGAGAEVHVVEPWEGYAEMTARQVIARVSGTGDAELAAIQLYESAHKARETVLAAVERQLRTTTGRAAEVNQTRKDQQDNGG